MVVLKRVKKAVIPAAGLGTRYLPVTKAMPKEMLPILDKPAIQYVVEEAVASGIEDILIITGRGKRAIEDHFDRSMELEQFLLNKGKNALVEVLQHISTMANIHYVRQATPLGLGHAITCAKSFVGNEPFAVLLGDCIVRSEVPCTKQLLSVFSETESTVFATQCLPPEDITRCGIIDVTELKPHVYQVHDLVEKPRLEDAPSSMGIVGRYILTPAIFDALTEVSPGHGGEVQLTDALKALCSHEHVYGYEYEGVRYDIGTKFGYIKAQLEFALRDPDVSRQVQGLIRQIIE